MTDTCVPTRSPRRETGPVDAPDYLSVLIAMVSLAATQDELDAIMQSANRVAHEAYEGRLRMKELRQELTERALVIGL